jgi:hypothetical protein
MESTARKGSFWINLSFAGCSAALLALAHHQPELWFISLVALVPFLWRLCSMASQGGAVSIGMMLATLFAFGTHLDDLIIDPRKFLIAILAANVAFAVFAFGVYRAKKSVGLDPLAIALMWFPTEYMLISYTGMGNIFSIPAAGSGIIISFCSLFGFLLGSLVVVLINLLFMMLVKYVRKLLQPTARLFKKRRRESIPFYGEVVPRKCRYCFPGVRAPPLFELEFMY